MIVVLFVNKKYIKKEKSLKVFYCQSVAIPILKSTSVTVSVETAADISPTIEHKIHREAAI